jgi:hypothetical protein
MKRQTSNAVNSRHARIVLLSTGVVGNREIAERVDCTPTLVRRIIHRFNDGGIEAIEWYPYYCRLLKSVGMIFARRASMMMTVLLLLWSPSCLLACGYRPTHAFQRPGARGDYGR